VALFDWRLALCSFWLVTFIGVTQDNLINVFGHTRGLIGYRNFDTKDNSHNNILLGYLGWGQGWHNNHHHDPKSYDFGSGVSGRWWEWDPARIFLPFLK
jgi:stearoyl-CoA desaturase (delta-9 desaturase)